MSGEAGDPYNPYNYFKRHRCPYSDYDDDSDDFGEDESEEESEDEISYGGGGHTMGMVGAQHLLVECLAVPAIWVVKVGVLHFGSNTSTVHAYPLSRTCHMRYLQTKLPAPTPVLTLGQLLCCSCAG